jgi:hypothetical protein
MKLFVFATLALSASAFSVKESVKVCSRRESQTDLWMENGVEKFQRDIMFLMFHRRSR